MAAGRRRYPRWCNGPARERFNRRTDLALDVGFASHSHFTDAFRREFGVSPSDLRRSATLARLAGMPRRLAA
ncbi:MAG: helix-turn-helix domain-containing protein [Candidatus Eisenbacteria bacterium]